MSKECERCGAVPQGEYELLDYCATCSKDLCGGCMAKGCCGKVPAVSGESEDFGADADREMLGKDAGFLDNVGNK